MPGTFKFVNMIRMGFLLAPKEIYIPTFPWKSFNEYTNTSSISIFVSLPSTTPY